MNKQEIVNKVLVKLGMIGEPQDLIKKEDLLNTLWNEKDPKKVIKLIQNLFFELKPSKEAKQDLFKFFKLKGLFKRSVQHPNMEKAWRLWAKEYKINNFRFES